MSDSDEAPEEVTFSDSRASIKRQERLLKEAEAESNRKIKEKRRARDQRLRDQQSTKKQREILKQMLKEDEEEDEEDENDENGSIKIKPVARGKVVSLQKEGVTVTVSKPRVKKLPPKGKTASLLRDKFLFRHEQTR